MTKLAAAVDNYKLNIVLIIIRCLKTVNYIFYSTENI